MSTFNGLEYIASYPDLIAAFGANEAAGRQHYETLGVQEGRTVSFNALEYIATYDDLIQALGANEDAGAAHYIANGSAEGRGVGFDGLQYIATYDDLIQALGANEDAGAAHYIANGSAEGRVRDDFSAEQYLAKYGDLQAAFGNDLEAATRHYITNGFAEGRTDDGGGSGGDPLWANGLEILPLGDSITRGSGSVGAGGYRGPLGELFADAGLPVDFVGQLQGGSIPDPDHQGVSGRTATTLSELVTGITAAVDPEAVLLLIGTNDVLSEANAASTVPGEVIDIVNKIHAVDPATHVLVGELLPLSASNGADVPARLAATNIALIQAVNGLEAEGRAVSLVDTSGITVADLNDGIHPNPTGYEKLARIWFDAVQEALPPPDDASGLAMASTAGELAPASAAHDFFL